MKTIRHQIDDVNAQLLSKKYNASERGIINDCHYAVGIAFTATAYPVEADDLRFLLEWARHDMDTFAYDRLERECFDRIAAKYSEVEG